MQTTIRSLLKQQKKDETVHIFLSGYESEEAGGLSDAN
jgi:hypothetical protein